MTDLRAAIAVTLVPYSDSSVLPTQGDVLDHGRAGKWIVTSVAAAERAAAPTEYTTCPTCGVASYAPNDDPCADRIAAPPAQAEPQPEEGDGK